MFLEFLQQQLEPAGPLTSGAQTGCRGMETGQSSSAQPIILTQTVRSILPAGERSWVELDCVRFRPRRRSVLAASSWLMWAASWVEYAWLSW